MEDLEDFCFEVSEDEEDLLRTQKLQHAHHAFAFFQPSSYSKNRTQVTKVYLYECGPSSPFSSQKTENTTEDVKPIKSLFISFESRDVPTSAVSKSAAEKEHFSTLQQMFQERPVWLKQSLVRHLPVALKKNTLKQCGPDSLLSCVAYSFENGPWRNAYVRLAYDPRADPASAIFQVMDMRSREERQEGGQLVQLCDVDDDGVRAIVSDPDSRSQECMVIARQKQTGWLTSTAFSRLRKLIKAVR